jgi:hypothetical protein
MIVLTAQQIRWLKVGQEVTLDKLGKQKIKKVVLWQGGGGIMFESSKVGYSLKEVLDMHISVEELKRDRTYC